MALRLLLSGLLGLSLCALLLLAMALLIGGAPGSAPAHRSPPTIDVVLAAAPPATAVAQRQPPPPPPPPPPLPTVASSFALTPTMAAAAAPALTIPTLAIAGHSAGLTGLALSLTANDGVALPAATAGAGLGAGEPGLGAGGGAAVPLLRIDPRYPPKALREGKEGWVKLRFTIAADGTTKDIEVLDAKPRRLFEAEAKRALARWKYQPRLVDGRAVEQAGELVQLDFVLERP